MHEGWRSEGSARRTIWVPAVLAGGLLIAPIASCGSDSSDGASTTGTTATTEAEVITATELLDRLGTDREGENVIVDAVLFEDESGMRICEALAESFPPQCGGRSIAIRNPGFVDAAMTQEQGIRWTDRSVWLLGWIEDGEFVVS